MNGKIDIYDVAYRGEYKQFYLPKKAATVEQKVAKQQRNFIPLSVSYTTLPVLILPAQENSYFLLQNLDAAADLWLGIDQIPDVAAKRGILIPALQAYEPWMVPQNNIYVVGSVAGLATLLYSLD